MYGHLHMTGEQSHSLISDQNMIATLPRDVHTKQIASHPVLGLASVLARGVYLIGQCLWIRFAQLYQP